MDDLAVLQDATIYARIERLALFAAAVASVRPQRNT
jgi:hypothetical protein